jgi:hypothetical protein
MNDLTIKPAQLAKRGNAVETARAVSEVQAAVTVAQARPRDVARAMDAMRQSCNQLALAESAFYRFNRGGEQITGPSIQLATELARCWGNMSHGVRELSRSDGESEMLAYAWDLETNMRADTSFIVPHVRDKRSGQVSLTDARDIYENNANNAARRLREMIFRVLPPWYRDEATGACHKTLERGKGDTPLPVRISAMLDAFAKMGIGRDRIEARLGIKPDAMTPVDLGSLAVVYRSLQRGETTKELEFPTLTAMEVARQLAEEEHASSNESAPAGEGE